MVRKRYLEGKESSLFSHLYGQMFHACQSNAHNERTNRRFFHFGFAFLAHQVSELRFAKRGLPAQTLAIAVHRDHHDLLDHCGFQIVLLVDVLQRNLDLILSASGSHV